MPLPPEKRREAHSALTDAKPLRPAPHWPGRLPILDSVWEKYVALLRGSIAELVDDLAAPPAESFAAMRDRAKRIDEARRKVWSVAEWLEPFAPPEPGGHQALYALLEELRTVTAERLIDGEDDVDLAARLLVESDRWARLGGMSSSEQLMSAAFGVEVPVHDDDGTFRADWVMQAHAYRNGRLHIRLWPQLLALGVPVTDPLAAVSAVGWIINSPDPVLAFIAFRELAARLVWAEPARSTEVRNHLRRLEPSRRYTRDGIAAIRRAPVGLDAERSERIAAAAVYLKELEGPFRQFLWATHVLAFEGPLDAPTLGTVQEKVASSDFELSGIVRQSVLRELRNNATHETLHWDPLEGVYVTEAGLRVKAARVDEAYDFARSVSAGGEAAFAAVNALSIDSGAPLSPLASETNRLAAIDRALGFFGTNRLTVRRHSLDRAHAVVELQRVHAEDVNPCFQALLVAAVLLPHIESFKVSTAASSAPIIELERAAIEATRPVWEFSRDRLDKTPLSAFLPMNLAARLPHEEPDTAVAAIAWIAADDAVGALAEVRGGWDAEAKETAELRLELVERALTAVSVQPGLPARILRGVYLRVHELRTVISSGAISGGAEALLLSPAQRLVRLVELGRVRRHPLIADVRPEGHRERRTALRRAPDSPHFVTM